MAYIINVEKENSMFKERVRLSNQNTTHTPNKLRKIQASPCFSVNFFTMMT